MTVHETGICTPWVVDTDIATCVASPAAGTAVLAAAAATDVLYKLSGRQYGGVCTRTIRPTRCGCIGDGAAIPVGGTGQDNPQDWLRSFGNPNRQYWCDYYSYINLGYDYVNAITSVTVDGVAVNASKYRVDEETWLVRTDGTAWPVCPLRMPASSAVGTFEVVFTAGIAQPAMGTIAARVLACEILKMLNPGSGSCALPKRTQSLTRQGMSVTMLDPFDFLDKGRTGIYEVDLFINTENPQDLMGNAVIAFPGDVPPAVRQTSP